MERRFTARASEVQNANAFLQEFLADRNAAADEITLFDLRLAVTETFANIIEHSYGGDSDEAVIMKLDLAGDVLEITFEDTGRRPEPHRLKSRDLDDYRERGLGLFLISRCMDDVDFDFRSDGINRLRMKRRLGSGRDEKSYEHYPFHVAVFERDERKTICLVGHFDSTRSNPFKNQNVTSSENTLVDLRGLAFIDSFGMQCLSEFCRSSAERGHRVSFVKDGMVEEGGRLTGWFFGSQSDSVGA